MIPDVKLLN